MSLYVEGKGIPLKLCGTVVLWVLSEVHIYLNYEAVAWGSLWRLSQLWGYMPSIYVNHEPAH